MRPAAKPLSILVLIYLLSGFWGISSLFKASSLELYYALVCILCMLLGLIGLWAAFQTRQALYRVTSLWAMGIPTLVYLTNDFSLMYPTLVHFPLTLVGNGANGAFTKFGIDGISAVLFLLVWFISKPQWVSDLSDSADQDLPPQN